MIAGRASLGALASLFSSGVEVAPPASPAARRALRKRMFSERPLEAAARIIAAGWAAVAREGVMGCLRAIELLIREKSIGALGLPDPERALSSPDGLCGVADDLSVGQVMDAYGRGLYPESHIGPMKWWAPSIRAIAAPRDLHMRMTPAGVSVAFDSDFDSALCDDKALIGMPPRLRWAFARLFDAGFAHSFDICARNGERIGRGFGVAVGRTFVIESMRFKDDESRVAGLGALARNLDKRRFAWIDAKRFTPKLEKLGFRPVERQAYGALLMASLAGEKVGRWAAPDIRIAA